MNIVAQKTQQLDTVFYSKFLKIALPIAMQAFMTASLNLIDNIMVGQLGETSIAGVGLANQYCFILQVILFGVCGGGAIFISQFWGSRNITNIRKILGLSLILGVSAAFIFFLAGAAMPRKILSLFSGDGKVILEGSSFLRVISFSFMFNAMSLCFSTTTRSTGAPVLPMITSIIAVVSNTCMNYLLIFGHFGFPKLGVAGAATSTLIARIIEFTILLTVIYVKKEVAAAKLHELFSISRDFVKRFVTTSSAVILKDIIWVVGTTIYMVIYARIGTEAVASVNIVSTIKQLAYVFFTGISNACLIMVGNQIGANHLGTAFTYAKRFLKITVSMGLLVGSLVIILRPLILSPYNVAPAVIHGVNMILLIVGINLFMEVFNMVAVVGVMRSGGDIHFCIVMDIAAVWFIGLPLALLGGMILKLPVYWVFGMVAFQEVFKFILCLRRIASKRWINNVVNDIA